MTFPVHYFIFALWGAILVFSIARFVRTLPLYKGEPKKRQNFIKGMAVFWGAICLLLGLVSLGVGDGQITPFLKYTPNGLGNISFIWSFFALAIGLTAALNVWVWFFGGDHFLKAHPGIVFTASKNRGRNLPLVLFRLMALVVFIIPVVGLVAVFL